MDNQIVREANDNTRNAALNDLVTQVQNEKTRSYIATRLIPQMEWYSREGRKCKKQYHRWVTITILLGASIPVVSVFADGSILVKALLVALGSIVTACNAYVTMNSFKELWLTYRGIREKLLKMLYCYFNNADVFNQDSTQEAKDVLLISICEEEMSSENGKWMSFMQTKVNTQ